MLNTTTIKEYAYSLGFDIARITSADEFPEDEQIIIATNKGEPVVYDKRLRSGRAFVNAAHRMMGEEVPLDEVSEAPSLVERLRRLMGFGPALAEKQVRS